MLNEDYKEMLQILLKNNVKFLVVGAYAMGACGYPRATGDIDLWVEASSANSKSIYKSLKDFGAPLSEIDEDTFNAQGLIFQIGVAPRRIDIITKIDGVVFSDAYNNKQEIELDGLKIPFLSKSDIIKNKKAAARDKDLIDIKYLNNENE